MNASGSSDTHDSARGLSRGRRSGLLSMSHTELSARETFPLLDASPSRFVEAALFFLPPQGEIGSPPPRCPRQWRSESRCLRMPRLKCPCSGDRFWSPWPFSWPFSPTPGRAPEPASSSKVGFLGFRVAEPDTGSAPPSLSNPEKIDGEAQTSSLNVQAKDTA